MNTKWILRIACMMQVASIGILFTFETARMKDVGIGETTIGILLGISSGVFIFGSIFWGRLADRRHCHKLIAVWGSFAFSALLIYFSICNSTWQFLIYAIGRAIAGPMVLGMMPALAVKAIGPNRQGRNFGVYRAFGSLGFILGSLTLPMIFDDIGTIAQAGSLVIFVSSFLLLRLQEPESKGALADPLRILELNPTLKLFFVSFFFITLSEPSVLGFFSAYARHLGGSNQLLGVLSGSMGFIALIFLPLMGKWIDRASPAYIISIAFLAQPLRVLINSFIGQAEMLWIPLLLHGLCWGGVEVAAIVYLSSLVKEGQKGTVLGYYIATRMLGHLIGASFSGYLAEDFGYVVMFRAMSVAGLLGACIYITGTYVFNIRRNPKSA